MSPSDFQTLTKLSRAARKGRVILNVYWKIAWAFFDIPTNDPDYEPDDVRYCFGRVKCRICGYEEMAFWPSNADETRLECSECEHPTTEPMTHKAVWIEIEEEC